MKFLETLINLEKKAIAKIVENTTYLKLLALVIAVGLFITFNGTGLTNIDKFFEHTETFEGIPLKTTAGNNKIVEGLPETISVNVSGSEANIKNFGANKGNIIATLDISSCGTKDGECTIANTDIDYSNTYGLNVSSIKKNFTFDVDTKTTVTYPVEATYINQDTNKGLILQDPELKQKTVTFEIGMQKKERIGTVRALMDLSKITDIEKGEYTFSAPIKVYDKNGDVLATPTDIPPIEIVQRYEAGTEKKLINYEITNNNTKKYISKICKDKITDKCADAVEVYGDQDKIAAINSVTYDVDMKDYSNENTTVTARPILEDGIYIKGDADIKVEISVEDGQEKTIKGVPITIQNLNSTFETPSIEKGTVDVTVTGAKSVVKDIDAQDISVYVDAKDIKTAQTITLPLETNISSTIQYNLSRNKVEVQFKEKGSGDNN